MPINVIFVATSVIPFLAAFSDVQGRCTVHLALAPPPLPPRRTFANRAAQCYGNRTGFARITRHSRPSGRRRSAVQRDGCACCRRSSPRLDAVFRVFPAPRESCRSRDLSSSASRFALPREKHGETRKRLRSRGRRRSPTARAVSRARGEISSRSRIGSRSRGPQHRQRLVRARRAIQIDRIVARHCVA